MLRLYFPDLRRFESYPCYQEDQMVCSIVIASAPVLHIGPCPENLLESPKPTEKRLPMDCQHYRNLFGLHRAWYSNSQFVHISCSPKFDLPMLPKHIRGQVSATCPDHSVSFILPLCGLCCHQSPNSLQARFLRADCSSILLAQITMHMQSKGS